MPELIGYLNGTLVRHIFGLRTLIVKFLSCTLAVGSGLPVGPEGPMIHMGAMVGAGIVDVLRRIVPSLSRLANSQVSYL